MEANPPGVKALASKVERWMVLAAGVGVMLTVGAAFSWSVFTHPLMAFFGWSTFAAAAVFALFVFFFGIGAIAGGELHDRFGPRDAVLLGASLWGSANVLAGSGLSHLGLWWLCCTYGVLGGSACGMIYVVPGATAAKWFPEERGLANGLTLCGFGFGALAFNVIAGSFPAFRSMIDAASRIVAGRQAPLAAGRAFVLPAAERHADAAVLSAAFVWAGLAFLVVGVLCAMVVHSPAASYAVPKAAAKLARERDFTPAQMLRSPAFYLVWLMLFVNATSGLALFSNAVPMYASIAGMTATGATLAFGTVSAANGIGRLLWAWLSDFIGRMPSLAICFLLEAIALFSLGRVHGPTWAAVAFTVVLLSFGGIFAIVPAVTADFFGTKFFGEDYSFFITAAAAAGIVGPLLVARLKDVSGSLTAWLTPIAVALVVSAFLPMVTRNPEDAAARTPASTARS